MAVYKRGYQRYAGPLTGRWTRFMVLPRYAWRRLYQQRLVLLLTMAAFVWPLLCAGFVYLTNHVELLQGLEPEFRAFIQVDGRFFSIFMYVQGACAVFLAALAGPGLLAPDLANNALPLYFSRPLTRWSYALARLTVLVGMLSVVTWIPGLLLFGLQVGLAGGWWFLANWTLGAGMVVGFLLWLLVLSLVAMASSAYVKWRVVAGAVSLAFFFILAGVSEMIDEVFRVTWGHVLDPAWAVNRVWATLLGVDPLERSGGRGLHVGAGGVRSPARPGDRTQAAAGGGGPMTEPRRADSGRSASRAAVVFEEVSKFYGEVLGVNRVTLNIPPGITSLVGPNGSGKTTLMNLMTGLIFPDHGRILMRGISPRDPEALMRMTGYATQYDTAPRWATGFTFITTGLLLFGYGRSEAEERAWKALERVSLTDAANRKVAAYSKGMRQRVRLAQAIAHDPDRAGAGRAAERPRPAGARGDDRPVPRLGRRGEARHPLEPRAPGGGPDQRSGRADRQRDDRGRGKDPQRARRDPGASQPVHRPVPRSGRIRRGRAAVPRGTHHRDQAARRPARACW